MPIITTLHARLAAWRNLSAATEMAKEALESLLANPHPIAEWRREDEIHERLGRIEVTMQMCAVELERAERELRVAQQALEAPPAGATATA